MKKICLAIVDNGYVSERLVDLDINTDPEDIKEAVNLKVDEYFADLEVEDEP